MPRIDQVTKAERKERVFLTLRRYPLGLKVMELAEITGFERRTLDNYLLELEHEGKVYKEEKSALWVALPWEQTQLRKFELSPEEAMTLYLAARLFAKQQDKRNEPAETALMKLATALVSDAKIGNEIHQAALELSRRPDSGAYNQVFRAMMQAYIYRRVLHLTYEPGKGRAFETDFSPFLLEPSAVGFTTYAIGYSSIVNDWRTYKLERIRAATLTRQEYRIPPNFPGLDILRSAWSIIWGEEVETVLLRFSPGVYRRVMETRWHPSETKVPDPDKPGYLRWSAQVADTLDMLPWVRGWGADVEVMEPKELREALVRETQKMAELYSVLGIKSIPNYLRLWAKADRETSRIHRLIYHMLDAGVVAQTLWDEALPNALKTFVAETCGLGMAETGRLISFWAALHDLGKASPIFQWHPRLSEALRRVIRPELHSANIALPSQISGTSTRHEIITLWALIQQERRGLLSETGLEPIWVYKIAAVISGHHGEFPKDDALAADQLPPTHRGGAEWDRLRAELFHALQQFFLPPVAHFKDAVPQEHENRFFTLVAAVVSVADWIGSNEDLFPYEDDVLELHGYAARSGALARCAIATLGWLPEYANPVESDFETLFKRVPRPIQQVVIDMTCGLNAPALVILEAPTGIGKTESALYLADQWHRQGEATGMYVAMPTMATSNQMYGRVKEFVQTRYGVVAQTLLVHSQAELNQRDARGKASHLIEDNEKAQDRVTALTWFLPRKRSLLTLFGVGTVDQSLMSILQTKHFFVRLFGLHRKVVIFDEVHAYDTYMTELFKLLLKWLRALDTSVIILSATLPEKTQREMVKAYSGNSDLAFAEYPRLTVASGNDDKPQVIPLPKPERSRHLALTWVERDPATIAAWLQENLGNKGCAAVICNTVDRAQAVYGELIALNPDCAPDDIILFHARMPRVWRNAIEKSVLDKFGPPGKSNRPGKSIVVATQVIEQSLDLDFDVLISDLAPIDFLIQRAGRLQRHERGNRQHPERLVLTRTLQPNGMPNFKTDVYVYQPYMLSATYFTLRNQSEIVLPDDTPNLIEQVYGEEEINGLSDIERAVLTEQRDKLEKADEDERREARAKLVRPPNDDRFLYGANADLDEDDPALHKAYRALTRTGDPGLALICLHRTARGLALEPGEDGPVFDENSELTPDQIIQILQGVVNVRRHIVVDHFLASELPKAWRRHHALRYHRLAVFEDGVYNAIPGLQLVLTEQLGLQYVERKEA